MLHRRINKRALADHIGRTEVKALDNHHAAVEIRLFFSLSAAALHGSAERIS
jgi:hypothetical protein